MPLSLNMIQIQVLPCITPRHQLHVPKDRGQLPPRQNWSLHQNKAPNQ